KMKAALSARQDKNLVIAGRTSALAIANLDEAVRRLRVFWPALRPADDAVTRQHPTAGKSPLCDLHPQILRGGARSGIQFAASTARSLRSLHQQPTPRGLGVPACLL